MSDERQTLEEELREQGRNHLLDLRTRIATIRRGFEPYKDSHVINLWANLAEYWITSLEEMVEHPVLGKLTAGDVTPTIANSLLDFNEGMDRWVYYFENVLKSMPQKIDDNPDVI